MRSQLDPISDALLYSERGSNLFAWIKYTLGKIDYIGSTVVIPYSFKLPERCETSLPYLAAPITSDDLLPNPITNMSKSITDIQPVTNEYQDYLKEAMKRWKAVTDIHFVEDNSDAPKVIFMTADISSTTIKAYVSTRGTYEYLLKRPELGHTSTCAHVYMVINKQNSFMSPAQMISTFAHEFGHITGLQDTNEHPKLSADIQSTLSQTNTIMDYNQCERLENVNSFGIKTVSKQCYTVISPSYYDIRVARVIHGESHLYDGDDTHDLVAAARYATSLRSTSYSAYLTFETISDTKGINTLSALNATEHVEINMNEGPLYRSYVHGHTITLYGERFVNVIGGQSGTTVVTNSYNNNIVFTNTQGTNHIISSLRTGFDVVTGFNITAGDSIVFHKLFNESMPNISFEYMQLNSTLSVGQEFGTAVCIDNQNCIFLKNVNLTEIDRHLISVTDVDANRALRAVVYSTGTAMEDIPPAYCASFCYGAGTTLTLNFCEHILKIGNVDQAVSKVALTTISDIIQVAASWYMGSTTTAVLTYFLSFALRNTFTEENYAKKKFALTTACVAINLVTDLTPTGAFKVGAGLVGTVAGSIVGSGLSFFASNVTQRMKQVVRNMTSDTEMKLVKTV